MGASQSARRITIDNDSDTVIKVSDSVVERLKCGTELPQTAEEAEDEDPKTNIQKQQQVRYSGISSNKAQPNAGQYQYFTHPFITSHQIRQEIEKELQENNQYWEKRISSLQADQEKMNLVMEDEYLKSSKELEKLLPRLPPKDAKLPCQGTKCSVISCYKEHVKQPLLCSKEVEAFTSCMTNMRIKLQNEDKLG